MASQADGLENRFSGVGVEWVRPIEDEILESLEKVSVVELTPENFFGGRSQAFLDALKKAGTPVVIHGIELSVGSLEPLKEKHLEEMLHIASQVNTVYFSEHLSYSEAGGVEIGELTPLHWTPEVCDGVCKKIDLIQSKIPYPFMIENIANRFVIPSSSMKETEFINRVLHKTGCGFQFDITNLYTNSVNFGFDPWEWMGEIDLKTLKGVQLAGGTYDEDGVLVDNHSTIVPKPVWELYEAACEEKVPLNTIIEWTDNFPPYEKILEEVEKARIILNRVKNPEGLYPGDPVGAIVTGGAHV